MKKILFFIFFIFLKLGAVEITLELDGIFKIKDEDTDKAVSAVYQGEEFKINVKVSGGSRDTSSVEFNNSNLIEMYKQGHFSEIRAIDNHYSSEVTYNYIAKINNIGLIEVGPALIRDSGKTFESNKILLKVIKKDKSVVVLDSNDKKKYELFCRLEADKIDVVEGEPIELSLKIYKRGPILEVGIYPPQFPGFDVKEIEESFGGQEDINGIVYSVLGKRYILIPFEVGLKEIKPINVSFNVPVKRKREQVRMGFFDIDINSFLGSNVKTEKTISNDLQINVRKLPLLNKSVDGIGLFSDFKMFVDKNEVILNEPILLTLEVSGIGGLDQIVAPKLNLPNGFSYYESKSKVEREDRISPLAGKKIFEYVLQVGIIGDQELKSQDFIYFDTQAKVYKNLKSNSISLKINKPLQLQYVNNFADNEDKKIINTIDNQIYKKDINFIEENIQFMARQSKKQLSFIWFFIFLMFPFLIYLKMLFLKLFKYLFRNFLGKNLSSKFESDLELIITQKKAINLYRFFLNYFSFKFDLQDNEVNESLIEKRLLSFGWSAQKVGEFCRIYIYVHHFLLLPDLKII